MKLAVHRSTIQALHGEMGVGVEAGESAGELGMSSGETRDSISNKVEGKGF